MENELQEDKKDTGGSLTVLKEYLLEKKNFPFAKTSWHNLKSKKDYRQLVGALFRK